MLVGSCVAMSPPKGVGLETFSTDVCDFHHVNRIGTVCPYTYASPRRERRDGEDNGSSCQTKGERSRSTYYSQELLPDLGSRTRPGSGEGRMASRHCLTIDGSLSKMRDMYSLVTPSGTHVQQQPHTRR